jgi:hypothetical protein
MMDNSIISGFRSDHYLRHNARRLEHFASLGIPVAGLTVLEVGAGIGDHSHYYIDRGCSITMTEGLRENLAHLAARYPAHRVEHLDLDFPFELAVSPFDLVHCYGLLYHLARPAEALEFLSRQTRRIFLLETCVSFGDEEEIHPTEESPLDPTQACHGTGCRPTRLWIFRKLHELFQYVYLPVTQPCHEEFPLDWNAPKNHGVGLQRAIFIASRHAIDNPLLTQSMIARQARHE